MGKVEATVTSTNSKGLVVNTFDSAKVKAIGSNIHAHATVSTTVGFNSK